MAKRIVTKVGYVFSVVIDEEYKAFFQFICIDRNNLGGDTIRVFKRKYPLDYKPVIEDVIKDDVLFYTHTILKFGIAEGSWHKVGKSAELGLEGLDGIWFGSTHGENYDVETHVSTKVDPLDNWHLWKANGVSIWSTKPSLEVVPDIEPGGVYPYSWVNERVKFGYYRNTSDLYDMVKRIPRENISSFMKRVFRRKEYYFHFLGENLVRIVYPESDGKLVKTEIDSVGDNWDSLKLWDINWKAYDFINESDFESVWNAVPYSDGMNIPLDVVC